MKKLLIAAAAMSVVAGAQAQSNVTIYGQMDVAYGESKTTGSTTAASNVKTTGLLDNPLTTSLFGVKGTEDLGGGNRASFTLETGINITGGTTINKTNGQAAYGATTQADNAVFGGSPRQQLVSIGSASLGDLSLGYKKQAELDAFESIALNTGNSAGGTAAKGGGRLDRANGFYYKSPVMSGIQATVQYSQGKSSFEDGTTDAGRKIDLNIASLTLNYANGPIKAVAHKGNGKATLGTIASGTTGSAVDAVGAFTAGGDNEYDTMILGGSYNFGFATANAIMGNRKVGIVGNSAYRDSDYTNFGVAVPYGKFTFVVARENTENNNTTTRVDEMTSTQVIAKYALSKRTTAYALYGKDVTESATAGTADVKTTRSVVGLVHAF
jgi:general bacterial porin, GBP family